MRKAPCRLLADLAAHLIETLVNLFVAFLPGVSGLPAVLYEATKICNQSTTILPKLIAMNLPFSKLFSNFCAAGFSFSKSLRAAKPLRGACGFHSPVSSSPRSQFQKPVGSTYSLHRLQCHTRGVSPCWKHREEMAASAAVTQPGHRAYFQNEKLMQPPLLPDCAARFAALRSLRLLFRVARQRGHPQHFQQSLHA